jgi:hypothetical protein
MAETRTEGVLSPRAIDLLRRACASGKTRAAALRDPKAVLARNGIQLGDDADVHLYVQTPVGRSDGANRPQGGEREAHFGQVLDLEGIPLGLQSWWASTHEGCPFGTYPYKTKKKKTVCDVWGLAVSGKEWVPVAEGSPYGHWEYTNVQSVCMLSHEVEVEVTECLPRFTVVGS